MRLSGSAVRPKWFQIGAFCGAVALVALGLAACSSVKQPGPPPTVTANPALVPGLDRSVSDYVDRCTPGTPTNVQVNASDGTAQRAMRRGLGEAVTGAATDAGHELGARMTTLSASPMGAPLYERMGFVTVGHLASRIAT